MKFSCQRQNETNSLLLPRSIFKLLWKWGNLAAFNFINCSHVYAYLTSCLKGVMTFHLLAILVLENNNGHTFSMCSKLALWRTCCRRTPGLQSQRTCHPKLKNVHLFLKYHFWKYAQSMYMAQFDKDTHDKNIAWHPSLAPKFCVLGNVSYCMHSIVHDPPPPPPNNINTAHRGLFQVNVERWGKSFR